MHMICFLSYDLGNSYDQTAHFALGPIDIGLV